VDHPKAKGDRSTLAIMLALHEAGYGLLVPFGENTRYDLVIDDGVRLARVQCKTGRLRNGSVLFNSCSSYAHHPNPRVVKRDYQGQIDYFAVFCPETRQSYLVPIADVTTRYSAVLRIDPPRNNQRIGVRFAADYEIGPATEEPGASAGACRSFA
jgi:PD-(D/E)XK endonuclease